MSNDRGEMSERERGDMWASDAQRRRAELMRNVAPMDTDAERDEQHARERLGRWLAAEPGRTWDHSDSFVVFLYDRPERRDPVREVAAGAGMTLAAAINDALERVT